MTDNFETCCVFSKTWL